MNVRLRGAGWRRGSALVVALIVVMMIGALSMSYLQMSMNKNREQQMAADAKRAFYMAEAGISEAYAGLRRGKSGNVGTDIVPARFGNGLFWVKAEELGNGHTCLTSTGMCGAGRACISIVVTNDNPTPAANGCFGEQGIAIGFASLIDSYDSRLGSYESQVGGLLAPLLGPALPNALDQAKVGSNGDITVQGTTARGVGGTIKGDAHPGPTGLVLRGTGSTITGSTTPSTNPVSMPPISVPPITQGAAIVQIKPSELPLPTGQVGYSALTLIGTGPVVVSGPTVLVLDSLDMRAGSTLQVDTTNGPVHIYVKNWVKVESGATIARTDNAPTKLSLLCAGNDTTDRTGDGLADPAVDLAGSSDFHGFLYAPEAAFTLPNTFKIYGAIAARQLTVAGGGAVHFDRAFLDDAGEGGAQPRELCWRLVQLPPSRLVEQRLDPMKALSLDGISPPLARDAHYDKGAVVPTLITEIWNRVTVSP